MALAFIVDRYVSFVQRELKDMTGKVVFVTGGNHGVGFSTVKHLALAGATVYMGSRDEQRGLNALGLVQKEITAEFAKRSKKAKATGSTVVKPGEVIYHPCDLSSPAQAVETAESLMKKVDRLDVLVNNAALLIEMKYIDQVIPVNHFGTFALTQALLPLLLKTAQENPDVRIVTVSSESHTHTIHQDPNIRFTTYEDFHPDFSRHKLPGFSIYGRSKLMNVMSSHTLQRKVMEQQKAMGTPSSHYITCIAVHPGGVDNFTDRIPKVFAYLLLPIVRIFLVHRDRGAYTSAFAAAGTDIEKEKEKYQASYLIPTELAPSTPLSRDVERQEELWESTLRILQDWPMKKDAETS